MPIEWKKSSRLKPKIVLDRIESYRSIDSAGQVSFSGLSVNECVGTLLSMLIFPSASEGLIKEALVWRALGLVKEKITPNNFLQEIQNAFRDKLAVSEQDYWLLTSMSIAPTGLPYKLKVLDCIVEFRPSGHPKRFLNEREKIIKNLISILLSHRPTIVQ